MQATVRSFDATDRSGQLVRDDGSAVVLAPGSLDPRVRALRPGQRLQLSDDGPAGCATLPGLSPVVEQEVR